MYDREKRKEILEKNGIIAVIRAPSRESIIPLGKALIKGGVRNLEITTSTPGAIEAIRDARQEFATDALVGVGTVLNEEVLREAIHAGAEFLVTPVLKPQFIDLCHSKGVPLMLGAYTPTEAQIAHECGSDYVKIFPADTLGPNYIKSIRAPMPHLNIVPTGGVNLDTAESFLDAGCKALGVGSSLVPTKWMVEENWDMISSTARLFSETLSKWRKKNEG